MAKRLAQLFRSIGPLDEDECSTHRWCEGGRQAFGKCHYIEVKNLVSRRILLLTCLSALRRRHSDQHARPRAA